MDKTVLCTGNYIRKKPFHLFAQKIGKTTRQKARISCSQNRNDIFLPFFAGTPKGCRLWIASAFGRGGEGARTPARGLLGRWSGCQTIGLCAPAGKRELNVRWAGATIIFMNSVKPGQYFCDTHRTVFGRAAPGLMVLRVFIGTDGYEYAELSSGPSSKDRRTLSTAILRDKRRFLEVSPQGA